MYCWLLNSSWTVDYFILSVGWRYSVCGRKKLQTSSSLRGSRQHLYSSHPSCAKVVGHRHSIFIRRHTSPFVPGCVSSPDLRRSLFVSSRMPASRHFWQIIWRYNSIQTNYVCIFVLLTVDWDCFLLSFFSYLSPRLTFVYFVYFVSSFLLYTISCQ